MLLSSIVGWLWPGAVLLLSAVWFTTTWEDATWFSQAVPLYVPVVFGVGLFLAWRFSRSRVSAVLIGLAGLNYLAGPLSGDGPAGSPREAGGVLLVILVGALSVFKDRGVFSRLGVVQPLIVGVSIGGSWALWRIGSSGLMAWTWTPVIPGGLASWSGLSDATVVGGLASCLLTFGMGIRRDRPVEVGLFWGLLAILLALASGADSDVSTVYLMVAGLILAIAVVETSYAMAFRDELTGLPARRALWQEMDKAGRFYAVGMLDIDHFKRFNNRHGHDIGDQVLRLVGSRLGKITGGGRAFRYGGEEFTVIFPSKGRDDAYDHLEALRKDIAKNRFTVRRVGRRRKQSESPKNKKHRKPLTKLSVTVSIGVAERSDKNPTAKAVVKAADEALYRAKKRGRNRVAK